jgi:replicative DNA helicase
MNQEARARHAERALLGGLLRNPEAVAEAVTLVREGDFYADAHRRVWGALVALWDRREPVDLATVADQLHRAGHLAELGPDNQGYVYLAELREGEPTGGAVAHHARMVRDKARLRRLYRAGLRIADLAEKPAGPAEEVLAEAERLVLEVGEDRGADEEAHFAEAVGEVFDRLDERERRGRGLSGLSTGFAGLDDLTAGLQPAELVVLAARPSVGKTALAAAVAANVAGDPATPVLFVSLEQRRAEIATRLLCARGAVDGHRLRRGRLSPEEVAKLGDAGRALGELNLYLHDKPEQRALETAARARRMRARRGLGLLVVDYLGLVEPENRKDPRHEQVGRCARRFKHLAGELAVPVLLVAQLNREVEHRAGFRPRLADLRDSGEVEQHADTVLLLHRPDPDGDRVEVNVAKQRNGPVGQVELIYDRRTMRFADAGGEGPW